MIAVTFHTGGVYGHMAENLLESAERVGLACEAVERPDLGTWWENTNQKPDVILEAMDRHPRRESILWVDADSEFVDFPGMLVGRPNAPDADLFIHFGYVWGSTMNFANTAMGRSLVEAWRAQCRLTPQYSSDSNMKAVLERNPKRWVIGQMPQEYLSCRHPEAMGLPHLWREVIHHQGTMDWTTRTEHVVRNREGAVVCR